MNPAWAALTADSTRRSHDLPTHEVSSLACTFSVRTSCCVLLDNGYQGFVLFIFCSLLSGEPHGLVCVLVPPYIILYSFASSLC